MITWDEWENTYKPINTEAYDNQGDIPAGVPFDRIWTMVDGDGIYANLITGYRWVNRLGYFVTEVPWTEEIFVTNQKNI
jgi:hypothetical protein